MRSSFRASIEQALSEDFDFFLEAEDLHWEIGHVYAFDLASVRFTVFLECEDGDEYATVLVRADLTTTPPRFEAKAFGLHGMALCVTSPDDLALLGGYQLYHCVGDEMSVHEAPASEALLRTDDGFVVWDVDGVHRQTEDGFEPLPFEEGADVDVRGVSSSESGLIACGSQGGVFRFDGKMFRKVETKTTEFLTSATDTKDGAMILAGDDGFVAELKDGTLTPLEVASDSEIPWHVARFQDRLYMADGDSLFYRDGLALKEVREFSDGAFVWSTPAMLTTSSYQTLYLFDGNSWTSLQLGDDDGEFITKLTRE